LFSKDLQLVLRLWSFDWQEVFMAARISLFCFVVSLLGARADAITFAQLALGEGYECVLIVSNSADSDCEVAFKIRQGNGDLWSGEVFVNGMNVSGTTFFGATLAAQGSRKLTLTGDDTLRVGYLELVESGHCQIDKIAVSFFYNLFQNGILLDSTATRPAALDTQFVLPVERSVAVNTGLAWAPGSSTDPFDIEVRLFDAEGAEVGSETISFEGHLARFFTEIFNDVPESFVGSVRIQSEQAIHLDGLRLEFTNSGFQLTSVPPQSVISPY
jgi:hypothetical protein